MKTIAELEIRRSQLQKEAGELIDRRAKDLIKHPAFQMPEQQQDELLDQIVKKFAELNDITRQKRRITKILQRS